MAERTNQTVFVSHSPSRIAELALRKVLAENGYTADQMHDIQIEPAALILGNWVIKAWIAFESIQYSVRVVYLKEDNGYRIKRIAASVQGQNGAGRRLGTYTVDEIIDSRGS